MNPVMRAAVLAACLGLLAGVCLVAAALNTIG
jgi:hypothetical protein